MKNSNETLTVNEIFELDTEKLIKGERLMPLSLAECIQKRHYLRSVDDCFDKFEEALKMAKNHKEAFGFIPDAWNDYFISIKLSLNLKDNPTEESYIDDLIKLHTARFAHIARIMNHKENDYMEEELLEMSVTELRDVLDELNPVVIKCTRGTATGGISRTVTTIKKAA